MIKSLKIIILIRLLKIIFLIKFTKVMVISTMTAIEILALKLETIWNDEGPRGRLQS